MIKILFICGKNRRRSLSAEEIFSEMDGMEVSRVEMEEMRDARQNRVAAMSKPQVLRLRLSR
jgi:predicted protein tyrosine phosphatase